ncbi:MAG: hypothetical protein ABIR19_11695 [Ginsengibacter sp.]
MKKYFLLLPILFFTMQQCFSQKVLVNVMLDNKKSSARSDTIYYDFNRKLKWEDFQGKPDLNHFGGAVTASGYAFDSELNYDGQNIYLNIKVYTFFSKLASWKKSQINSDYHLLHEQHHFDITRLGAEQLVEKLKNAKFTSENYVTLLNSIFDNTRKESDNLQKQYDRETIHSIDTARQDEWNKIIESAIQQLSSQVAKAP